MHIPLARNAAVGGTSTPVDELLNEEMKKTKAYQNRKVVVLPGNIWYLSGGGLISVKKQIEDVSAQLYGLAIN